MYSFRVEQAIKAASILHKDQIRKGENPLPYITHLFAVAVIVSDYSDNEDTFIAALLHDTLEDTDYTPAEIEEDFGIEVKKLVEAVSEPDNDLGWIENKKQYVKQVKKGPLEAVIISAADKIHNMRSIVEEYYSDHSRFMNDFGQHVDERMLVYQDLSNIINSRLKSDIVHEFNHVFTEYKNFISDVKKTQAKSRI